VKYKFCMIGPRCQAAVVERKVMLQIEIRVPCTNKRSIGLLCGSDERRDCLGVVTCTHPHRYPAMPRMDEGIMFPLYHIAHKPYNLLQIPYSSPEPHHARFLTISPSRPPRDRPLVVHLRAHDEALSRQQRYSLALHSIPSTALLPIPSLAQP
jgi:hypothetical protein